MEASERGFVAWCSVALPPGSYSTPHQKSRELSRAGLMPKEIAGPARRQTRNSTRRLPDDVAADQAGALVSLKAGRRQAEIGLVARPASPAQQGTEPCALPCAASGAERVSADRTAGTGAIAYARSAQRRFANADGQEHVAERSRAVPRATRCRSMIDATVLAGDVQCFEIVWREASLAGAVTTPRNRCGPCSACWTAGWRDAERTL